MAMNWSSFVGRIVRSVDELRKSRELAINVMAYPPKNGPWTGNNILGIDYEFELVQGNTQAASILKLPEWGFPEMWTVAFGIDTSRVNFPISSGFDVTAILTVGSGGTTQTIEVDWGNGNMVSLPMNALTVSARSAVSATVPGAVTLGFARLTTTLSRGTRPGASWPTRSYRSGTIFAGADSLFFQIPDFARRVDVVSRTNSTDLYNAASFLEFWVRDNAGSSCVGRVPTAMLLTIPDGIAIPSMAEWVRLHNGSGANLLANWSFKIGI